MINKDPEHLLVLWTSRDPDTARNMVLMYTYNAKVHNWWPRLTLLIWGASPILVGENSEIQTLVKEVLDAGVRVIACRACAEREGLVEVLEGLGVEVFYTGEFITEWLKSGNPLITI